MYKDVDIAAIMPEKSMCKSIVHVAIFSTHNAIKHRHVVQGAWAVQWGSIQYAHTAGFFVKYSEFIVQAHPFHNGSPMVEETYNDRE